MKKESTYMNQNSLSKREFLKSVINDILEEKDDADSVNSLDDSMSLTNDLGLDSLDLAEMTVRLEDQYGIDVFEDDIVDKIGEVIEKLDS
jgi:acyl carrier protein